MRKECFFSQQFAFAGLRRLALVCCFDLPAMAGSGRSGGFETVKQ
jgi:hypothetical protein